MLASLAILALINHYFHRTAADVDLPGPLIVSRSLIMIGRLHAALQPLHPEAAGEHLLVTWPLPHGKLMHRRMIRHWPLLRIVAVPLVVDVGRGIQLKVADPSARAIFVQLWRYFWNAGSRAGE